MGVHFLRGPEMFLASKAKGFVLPGELDVREEGINLDVGGDVKGPGKDLGDVCLAGEGDRADDSGWDVLVLGGEEEIAAGECRGELLLQDRYAFLAEDLHVVFCADAQDSGDEGEEG